MRQRPLLSVATEGARSFTIVAADFSAAVAPGVRGSPTRASGRKARQDFEEYRLILQRV